MTRLMRAIQCFAMTATLLTASLVEPAAAKHGVPFKGFFQAVEESFTLLPPDVPFPTLIVDGSGSGRATRLGRFNVDYEFEVNLDNFFGVGSTEFVGARGDGFTTSVEGQGTVPTADGISFIVETHVITGGTGRFEGATGGFTMVRVLNVFTGVTFGWFDGTIVLD